MTANHVSLCASQSLLALLQGLCIVRVQGVSDDSFGHDYQSDLSTGMLEAGCLINIG